MDAAYTARLDGKIEVLARAAAEGVRSGVDAMVDESFLHVAAIADLEVYTCGSLASFLRAEGGRYQATEVGQLLPGQPAALAPVLATLVRHGLRHMLDAMIGFAGPAYEITDYGRFILEYFQERPSGGP